MRTLNTRSQFQAALLVLVFASACSACSSASTDSSIHEDSTQHLEQTLRSPSDFYAARGESLFSGSSPVPPVAETSLRTLGGHSLVRVSDGGSNAPATSEAEVDFEELRLYLDSVDDREPVHFVIHLEGAPALDFRELAGKSGDEDRNNLIESHREGFDAFVHNYKLTLERYGVVFEGASWGSRIAFVHATRDEILSFVSIEKPHVSIGDNMQWETDNTGYVGLDVRLRSTAQALSALTYDGNFVTNHGGPVRLGFVDEGYADSRHPAFDDSLNGPTRWVNQYRCGGSSPCIADGALQTPSTGTHAHSVASVAASSTLQGQDPSLSANAREDFSYPASEAALYMYDWSRPTRSVTAGLVNAIDQAILDDIDILNMSFNVGCANSTTDVNLSCSGGREAIRTAYQAGILIVVAAGNSGPAASTMGFPAVRPEVLTVGSLDASIRTTAYQNLIIENAVFPSSRGPVRITNNGVQATTAGIDLLAPHRMAVGSMVGGGYGYGDCFGTSCAAPVAAGFAVQVFDGLDALGWTAVTVHAGRFQNFLHVLGDASTGLSSTAESNWEVSPTGGYGRFFPTVPSSADLTSPWGWGAHSFIMHTGDVTRLSVWDSGPESSLVTEWKWALSWDEPNLSNMRSDIVISVENTCVPGGGSQVVTYDSGYAPVKRIHLEGAAVRGKCLEMVIQAVRTPAAGEQVFMTDYFHGGNTDQH